MAMLSDPGGFSKAAEKQAENMKAMGIEQTDQQKPVKKEEGPKWGMTINSIIYLSLFKTQTNQRKIYKYKNIWVD